MVIVLYYKAQFKRGLIVGLPGFGSLQKRFSGQTEMDRSGRESQKVVHELHLPGTPSEALIATLARLGMSYADTPIEEIEKIQEGDRFGATYRAKKFGVNLMGSVVGEVTAVTGSQFIAARLLAEESTFPIIPADARFSFRQSGTTESTLRLTVEEDVRWEGKAKQATSLTRQSSNALVRSLFITSLDRLPHLMDQPVSESPLLRYVAQEEDFAA